MSRVLIRRVGLPLELQEVKGPVFVTGGTGLLGKRIVLSLHQLGYGVRILSRTGSCREDGEGIEFVHGDIKDATLVERAMAGCDAVFHCAGELYNADRMHEVNVIGTRNVYNAARKNRVRFFCHLSSVGVMGKLHERVVDEHAPCNPMNAYERTKLEAELIVEKGIEGCRSVILRPTNIFSDEKFPVESYASVRRAIRVWLSGKERSHLVYDADVAAAGIHLLQTSMPEGCETFIVSSDEEAGGTHADVYVTVRRLLGRRFTKMRCLCPIRLAYWYRLLRHGESNLGDVCYSSRRLLSTGFEMPFGWRKGVTCAVEYYRERVKGGKLALLNTDLHESV